MVLPRPRAKRPPRLRRPLHGYLKALRKVALVKAAIAEVAQLRQDDPDRARDMVRWLPAWLRPLVQAETLLPKPDIRVYYRRGHGRMGPRGQGPLGQGRRARAKGPTPPSPAPEPPLTSQPS
jgi:hypothetical protein